MSKSDSQQPCFCCSGQIFARCCEPFLSGDKFPETPEQLMRSRYCAFVLVKTAYIEATMRGAAMKAFDFEETRQWASQMQWLGLQVCDSEQQGDTGYVEFIARFKQVDGQARQMHEKSKFKRIDGRWYYVNTVQNKDMAGREQKVGRNDPCHCGSGKKFKKCCGV